MDYNKKFNEYLELINNKINNLIPNEGIIYEAMNYSLKAGGKRIRPIMVLEFCQMCGGDINKAMPLALATEIIHTYSLIHDDLPCMDDDDLRRGKPTNHKVFGEAMAVLAGDALLNFAFESVLESGEKADLSETQIIKALKELSTFSGSRGMIGGQVVDLLNENKESDLETLNKMHNLKTGALFKASSVLGCIAANASDDKILEAKNYAQNIGLAFQITDDILDVTGDANKMGKNAKSDISNNKSTFVSILGLQKANEFAVQYTNDAKAALNNFPNNEFMLWLSDMLINREM